MDDEDGGPAGGSLPEVFRRVLERLDRFAPLPPGTRFLRTLGPGTPGPQAVSIAEREPATDVIEGPHTIFVTVELPGVSRKDIDLHATETTLVVIPPSTLASRGVRSRSTASTVVLRSVHPASHLGCRDSFGSSRSMLVAMW